MIINAEIRGNKYNIDDLDNMLSDYLNIGENVVKLRKKKVDELYNNFVKKYSNNSQLIIKAKELYQMAEFYFCQKAESFLENYRTYHLRKGLKGAKVYVYFKKDACIGIIYDSIPCFLLEWFIFRRVMEV